jgi:hypothetical protein
MVNHIVGSVFGPIRFLLPVCQLSWFLYTLNIYAHFSQQLLMTEIWYLVTSFIYVPHIVGRVFGPIRFLLPVCRLCWFLYTLNVYAHFSLHFSQQLLMAEIWFVIKIIKKITLIYKQITSFSFVIYNNNIQNVKKIFSISIKFF